MEGWCSTIKLHPHFGKQRLCYNYIMITQEQRDKIREFAREKPIQLVYLFGSYAQKEAKALSDYDFAILFNDTLKDEERFNLKLEAIVYLAKLLGDDRVDVLDLNVSPPAFRYAAIAPRQDIYAKSELVRVEFEKRAMSEYFDRLYYLKRHTMASLSSIAKEGLSRQHEYKRQNQSTP